MRALGLRHGFTMLELLVSAALVALVALYATGTFTVQQRSFATVDQVTEAQQNARAIALLLERELRETAFLVPEAAAVCGADSVNGPDLLFATDAEAVDPSVVNRADLGATVVSGFTGGTGSDDLVVGSSTVDGVPAYDTDGNGTADSDFRPGAGAILVDRANPERGAACGVVTDVAANAVGVDYPADGGGNLGAVPLGGNPADLVVVPAHVYTVSAQRELLRDGMPLARGVEDLQFALFYDVDGDGEVDSEALEVPGSEGGTVYASSAWNNEDLREIRAGVAVRSRLEDPEFGQGRFQTLENRNLPGSPEDGFRRRVASVRVKPRNVGLR